MKILCIGDFHGKFPEKLKKIAKNVDLVLSTGDYFARSHNKIFLKYGPEIYSILMMFVSDKRIEKNEKKDNEDARRIIKSLNGLGKKVFTTVGNYDGSGINDQYSKGTSMEENGLLDEFLGGKKNVERIDYRLVKFGGWNFIGGFGHSSPGDMRSAAAKKYKKKLSKLFKKARGRVVFLVHNMPYGCELDVGGKGIAKGVHLGSKLNRWTVDKFSPELVVGGHIHEKQGECRVGKSLIVNTGAAMDGKACLVELARGKVKSVKFVR